MESLTSLEVAKIKVEVLGFPLSDTPMTITALTNIPPMLWQEWEPHFNKGDFSGLVSVVDSYFLKMNPDAVALVRGYLIRWDEICVSSQMRLTHGSAGEAGVIQDDIAELEKLRELILISVGIVVPMISWYRDMMVRMRYSRADQQMRNGDR